MLAALVLYLLEKLVEGFGELLEALGLEHVRDVLVVQADLPEPPEELPGLLYALLEGRPDLGVVHDRLDRALGHGVHGLGTYQVLRIHHIRIIGVLGGGRGPEEALPVGASLFERSPSGAAEDLLVSLVGQLGVGYGELALEVVGPQL